MRLVLDTLLYTPLLFKLWWVSDPAGVLLEIHVSEFPKILNQ